MDTSAGTTHLLSVSDAIRELDIDAFTEFAHGVMTFLKSGQRLFVGGNGGSLSIAEHLCTDWTKGIFLQTSIRPKIFSLNSVGPLQTAISNDLGYEYTLSLNIEMFASPNDAVFLISSSGNSPNILRAARTAKNASCKVFAFSGFGNSELCKLADQYLTIDSKDYQIVEDVHAILSHAIFKYMISNLR